MKQVDTGGLTFQEMRKDGKYYVDKSLLIKDMLDTNDRGIFLYTRPRRFGKTTNISMLDAFFNRQYEGNAWFDGLAISDYPEYSRYKNKHPVIYLNLKDTVADDLDSFVRLLMNATREAFSPFRYLLERDDVYQDEKAEILSVLNRTIDRNDLTFCVRNLCAVLRRCHDRMPVILIDEYDRAVSDAFGSERQGEVIRYLSAFLSPALKNNTSLQMAYVTGVTRVSHANMFSGWNNVLVNDVFSTRSDERFGFTEDEVRGILGYYGHSERFDEVRRWYDGYRFGDADVYNPYSVMMYVQNGFVPQSYWMMTSRDNPIRRLLRRTGSSEMDFPSLLAGAQVEAPIHVTMSFDELDPVNRTDLFSLMVMTGYLRAEPIDGVKCRLSIPNGEIMEVLDRMISENAGLDTARFSEFCSAVIDGDGPRMEDSLGFILAGSSYMTGGMEFPYEVLLLTMMRGIIRDFDVRMESEEGNGRVDIILKPVTSVRHPIIMELKTAASEVDLIPGAEGALKQIHDRRYYAGMKGRVQLIGISFWGKVPCVRTDAVNPRPFKESL